MNKSESPTTADWAAGRGDRWVAHLDGLEAMLASIDEPLVAALHLDAPYRIADIGCGGGSTAATILSNAPKGSVVHGFDISLAQVEAARQRTQADGERLMFEVADAATLAPSAPYERLCSRFGIMFFDDPPAAFRNLTRWLSPGGRLAFAVWASPQENPWMMIAREVVAEVVALPPPEPDSPGPFRYGDASVLLDLLKGGGFRDLAVNGWQGKLAIGGGLPAPEAAQFSLTASPTFADALAEAGEAAFQSAHAILTEKFSKQVIDGLVKVDARVHIVTGIR